MYRYYTAVTSLNITLGTTNTKMAVILQAPKDGNIDRVAFYCGLVSVAGDIHVRLETVDDATGDPSGNLYGGSAEQIFEITALGTQEVILSTPAAATQGDKIAIVLEYVADEFTGRINHYGQSYHIVLQLPYADVYTGSWTKKYYDPQLSFGYDDGTYPFTGCNVIKQFGTTGFNTGTSPDKNALRFKVPFVCKIQGIQAYMDCDGNFDVNLYNTDESQVLATASFDKDIRAYTNYSTLILLFSDEITLAKDTFYTISVEPTSETSVYLQWWSTDNNKWLQTLPMGRNWYWRSKTGADPWTDDTLKRPMIGLIISALDDGVSTPGGGGENAQAFAA
jgi:hypothetical protein